MKANELSIGWAMKQRDPVAAVQQVFENVRRYGLQVKANAALALVLILIGIGGAL